MLPLGKCPRRIALGATMVKDSEKTKNTNKTQLLASVLTIAQGKKAIKYQDLPGTLYSHP
jgi:hypothetical protein